MTPTTLTALKTVIKYIRQRFKYCKKYNPLCYQCQMMSAFEMLKELEDVERWRKRNKK